MRARLRRRQTRQINPPTWHSYWYFPLVNASLSRAWLRSPTFSENNILYLRPLDKTPLLYRVSSTTIIIRRRTFSYFDWILTIFTIEIHVYLWITLKQVVANNYKQFTSMNNLTKIFASTNPLCTNLLRKRMSKTELGSGNRFYCV